MRVSPLHIVRVENLQAVTMLKSYYAAVLLVSLSSWQAFGDGSWDAQFGVPGAYVGGGAAVVCFKNTVVVGGSFYSMGGIAATNLARWDGTNWAQIGGGVQGFVDALAVAGGQLYVAGSFNQVGEVQVNNVAQWDGTNWSSLGGGVSSAVFALAADGRNLYAGGHFTAAGPNPASKVARWDGTNWSALGSGIVPAGGVGAVDSLAIGSDGLYAGGRFRIAGGIAATNIARWDGTEWHALGHGLRLSDGNPSENGSVNALLMANGRLYAGGVFRLAGAVPAASIAGWDGTQWYELASVRDGLPLPAVVALAVSGGDLFAGGSFRSIDGVDANHVARWDGYGWSALGNGVSGRSPGVLGLASAGSQLAAVGVFSLASGQPSTNIALWHIPHALSVQRSETDVRVSWSETGSNFVLESSSVLGVGGVAQASWRPVPQAPVLEKPFFEVGQWVVTDALGSSNQFYRLRRR